MYESVTARQVKPGVDPASLEVTRDGAWSRTVDGAGNLGRQMIGGRVAQEPAWLTR